MSSTYTRGGIRSQGGRSEGKTPAAACEGPGGSRCEVAWRLHLCGFLANAAGGLGLGEPLTGAFFLAQGDDFISQVVESADSRTNFRVGLFGALGHLWSPGIDRHRTVWPENPEGAISEAPNELLDCLEVGEVPEVEGLYIDRPGVRGDAIGNHNELRRAMRSPKRDLKGRVLNGSSSGDSHGAVIEGAAEIDLARSRVADPDKRIIGCGGGVVAVADCLGQSIELPAIQGVAVSRLDPVRAGSDVRRPGRVRSTRGSVGKDLVATVGKQHLAAGDQKHPPDIGGAAVVRRI